jgi:predicted SnoaL-like aldol condensation-catalyzing enzyme
MITEESKAVVRRYVDEGMIGGDLSAVDRSYAPEFVYHNPVVGEMPSLPPGPEGVKLLIGATRAAFPDMRYTIDVIIAEGDMVSVFYSWTATHTGDLGGIPATGKRVSAMGAMACRVSGGKIVEEWDVDDRLGVMQQLGLLPATGVAAAEPGGT